MEGRRNFAVKICVVFLVVKNIQCYILRVNNYLCHGFWMLIWDIFGGSFLFLIFSKFVLSICFILQTGIRKYSPWRTLLVDDKILKSRS